MASLQDIRKRIKTVKNTAKTTKAMKMVSAAKLRRAQKRVMGSRPFSHKLDEVISLLAHRAQKAGDAPHPLLMDRAEKKKVELIVLTSDRGLCGAFNSNVVRRALRFVVDNRRDIEEIQLSTIGRKGHESLKREKVTIRRNYEGVLTKVSFHEARNIADELCEAFRSEEVDAVYLAYNEFKSVITQNLVVKQLLPVEPIDLPEHAWPVEYLYEPARTQLLDEVLPRHFATVLYQAFLESQASEHGARMSAMDSATRNAQEMGDKLTLTYNRVRQAAITTELNEIIGGAEALK
jgi:F-type H+-transporting ATPase subunit gamma